MREGLTFRAQGVRHGKPLLVRRSEKGLTVPKTPAGMRQHAATSGAHGQLHGAAAATAAAAGGTRSQAQAAPGYYSHEVMDGTMGLLDAVAEQEQEQQEHQALMPSRAGFVGGNAAIPAIGEVGGFDYDGECY